jgi:hypothetical protein
MAHYEEQKEIPKARIARLRDRVTNEKLVLRHFGIDLIAPGENAAGQVLYLETRLL